MSSVTSSSSSSSSTASTTDIFNGKIFGLASGLDVDSMVTGMVADIQSQIDKAGQSKQKLQWKQTAYESIVSALNTFNDSFLALSGSGSITASSALQVYTANSSDTSLVSAAAADGATGTARNITVYQSAAAASVSNTVDSSAATITGKSLSDITLSEGDTFNVTIDSVTKTVTITSDQAANTDKASALSDAINGAFGYTGSDKIVDVSADADGNLNIASADGYTSWITVSSASSLSDGQSDGLSALGITSGSSNRMDMNQTLATLLGTSDSTYTVNINGTDIALDTSKNLYKTLSAINSSGAGVTLAYDSTTNTISATATNTGAAYSFTLADTSTENGSNAQTLLEALGFSADNTTAAAQGRDAIVSFDGGTTKYTRSNNSFTISGVNYTINADMKSTDTAQTANITFTQDTSKAVTTIQNFVSAYNTLLKTITDYTNTKPDSDYSPLTDSQKENMSDTDISNWNSKAQEGILFNDDTLEELAQSLRDLVSQSVTTSDGTTITLGDLGIREDTSDDYTTAPGKLVFDDDSTDTLVSMLQNHSQEVQDLFTKQSSYSYLIDDSSSVTDNGTTENRQTARKNQEGIAYRLQDIISDYTSDSSSTLLQGTLTKLLGSSTDGNDTNSIYDQIQAATDKITDYKTKLTNKKNQLYSKFSLLESMMAKFNSTSSAISSLSGS